MNSNANILTRQSADNEVCHESVQMAHFSTGHVPIPWTKMKLQVQKVVVRNYFKSDRLFWGYELDVWSFNLRHATHDPKLVW
jgi:hypothetical protein